MKSLLIQTFCLLFLCLGTVRAQQYQLASPNGKLSVTVDAGEALTWEDVSSANWSVATLCHRPARQR